jgi:hypothetical protein
VLAWAGCTCAIVGFSLSIFAEPDFLSFASRTDRSDALLWAMAEYYRFQMIIPSDLAAVLVSWNATPVSLAFLKSALSAMDRIDSALSAHVLHFMDFNIGELFDCLFVITHDCPEAAASDEIISGIFARVASLSIPFLRFLRTLVKWFEMPTKQRICMMCHRIIAIEGGELDDENDLSFDFLHTIEVIFRRVGNVISISCRAAQF